MRAWGTGIVAGLVLAAAPAAQAATTEYGGGSRARTGGEGDVAVGLSLRVLDSGAVRYRLTTTVVCPGRNETYDVDEDGTGSVKDGIVTAFATRRLNYPTPRVTATYAIRVTLAGDRASGSVRVTGTRTRNGRKAKCTRSPDRAVQLHVRGKAIGDPVDPAALATYYGLVERDPNPARPSIVLSVGSTGRYALARWDATVPCDDGAIERFTNYSPRGTITERRYLVRETFNLTYADGITAKARATIDARFVAGGVNGTVRLRLTFFNKRKRHLTDCDSGALPFSAFVL